MFPRLFKYNPSKTMQWEIAVHPCPLGYTMTTSYGEIDGKLITRSKEIVAGKAGRSVLEQANLEAQSKWNDKKNKERYNEVLTKTTAIRPMLAATFAKGRFPFPCFVQRKYDGIRCIAYMKDGRICLESRKGIEFHNLEHIKSHLKLAADTVLDGELYTDALNFETICGLVRLKAADFVPETMNLIQYHIYDTYIPDMKYKDRVNIMQKIKGSSVICIVPTDVATSMADVTAFHNQYVAEGFEGIMLRDPVGIYEPDKRSKYLQKYKEFLEEEFVITGFHDGTEKGLVIWDCITTTGRAFAVKPRGSHEVRRELYKNAANYIGKMLTVIFQEYTADGTPRFPVGKAIRDIY